MSIVLAVDPNVLLAASDYHLNSRLAVRTLNKDSEQFCLGLDPSKEIFSAYKNILARLARNPTTKNFWDIYFRKNSKKVAIIYNAKIESKDRAWLFRNKCDKPVEPELIAVGKAAPGNSAMVVLGGEYKGNDQRVERGTDDPNTIDKLHKKFSSLKVWPVYDFDNFLTMIKPSRFPSNEAHLRLFIQEYGEDEYLEFKQPGKIVKGVQIPADDLTPSIILAALEEICCMINTVGGCVFVGVTKNRKLRGIHLVNANGNRILDDDCLSRRFADQLCRFHPSVNQFVSMTVIPLENGRRVVRLEAKKGHQNTTYSFDNGNYRIVVHRCGASKRSTKVLGRSKRGPLRRRDWRC